MMGDHDVTLAEQLGSATDADACFCISCGQPDEPGLHDPARCPGQGGTLDKVTVATALEIHDKAFAEEPDLEDSAFALWCIIYALSRETGPKVGDGTPDAALAIGEHAFRAGHEAALVRALGLNAANTPAWLEAREQAWSDYDPPEDIKALS